MNFVIVISGKKYLGAWVSGWPSRARASPGRLAALYTFSVLRWISLSSCVRPMPSEKGKILDV